MIKRILPVALLGAVILGAASCQNGSSFKKANGIEYMIIKDAPGKNAQEGDMLEMNIVWKVGKNDGKSKDSVIVDTRKMNNGKAITMPLMSAKFVGDMSAGLALLSAGDSAVIRVSIDSLKKNLKDQPMPPFAKEGEYFIYEVSMVSVKSKAEAEKEAQQKAAQQVQIDEKLLQEYFAKNNIKAEKTPSGVYYTISAPGTGENIAKGKTASIMYTGKLLDGKTFDSNIGKDALKINVGTGGVIPGMDEGLQIMKKGTKGTLYIPSALAYGDHGQGPIPNNAILIFEMEVKDVTDAKPEMPQAQPQPQAMK